MLLRLRVLKERNGKAGMRIRVMSIPVRVGHRFEKPAIVFDEIVVQDKGGNANMRIVLTQ